MILVGLQDIGPTKYLLALEPYISETIWASYPLISNLISDLNQTKNWRDTNPTLILTGTTLGPSIEKEMILFGVDRNIPTITVIDHWSWYKKRFQLGKNLIWPDHIIVNDNYAKTQAVNDGVPEHKIFVGGNPLLESIANFDFERSKDDSLQFNLIENKLILFISEEIHSSFPQNSEDYLGYDEYSVINDLIKVMPNDYRLLIKLHPEEKKDKYSKYLSHNIDMAIDWTFEMMIQIPDLIIGMQSMLLLELAMHRNDIICYRPNAKSRFYGEEMNIINSAKKINTLSSYLINKPKIKIDSYKKKFIGSSRKIARFIEKL